jgi:putative ABC transport system permease protein
MFHSALAAALRHLSRGKLYAAIAVLGLAVGLCAVLLAALFIRSQYAYEHFVPGYQDVYQVTTIVTNPDRRANHLSGTSLRLASLMKQRFPEIASVSRMTVESVVLRHIEPGSETASVVRAVDPNFFDTLPLTVLAGDAAAALAEPNKLVITREIARKFFGDEPPLGRTLEAELTIGGLLASAGSRRTMTVGAVIEDIPLNRSRLASGGIFVSGLSRWTQLGAFDHPPEGFPQEGAGITLVRLHPGASPQPLHDGLPGLMVQVPLDVPDVPLSVREEPLPREQPELLRIDRVHTHPNFNPAFTHSNVVSAALALVILAIATVNFMNLMTARSGGRALEVGVRKLAGASRTALALQFLGESFVYVASAVVIAVAMTELLLPHVNAFLMVGAEFKYWEEPELLAWLLLGAVAFGLLAGFWPALVLSSLRPLGVMHGSRLVQGSGGFLRQSMVALQFALPTAMLLWVGVIHLQRDYGAERALRFDTDQVVILNTGCSPGRMTELRKLAGVLDVACSSSILLGGQDAEGSWLQGRTRDGRNIPLNPVVIDDRMLEIYGVKPLVGRNLSAEDFGVGFRGRHSTRVLINEAAVRALGFGSPVVAVGPYPLAKGFPRLSNGFDEIIGVVPDFSMASARSRIGPTVFYADPMQFSTISLKLNGSDIPATLGAIDSVWKSTRGRGGDPPVGKLDFVFYNDRVQLIYEGMMVEARAFGIMSLVGISLALLGLLGLAASAADQRTKEIGIRKALGATTGDVLRLLLWQFSKPVVWANAIAWPVAGWFAQRFLNGFAYHIDLPLWLFPATTLAMVLIALATVGAHALRVARARPVVALRHE